MDFPSKSLQVVYEKSSAAPPFLLAQVISFLSVFWLCMSFPLVNYSVQNTRAGITVGWGGGGRTAKTSNFLQTSDLPMIMNTLDNSDDTISQTKLYQAAVSFYLSTFRSNSIQLNLKNKQTKKTQQHKTHNPSRFAPKLWELSNMSAILNLEKRCQLTDSH